MVRPMNEMKPEDVMRALDILDKMDFFEGQRAGRELWNDKPFDVQEQDIADFSKGIATVKKVLEDALAILREKNATIADYILQIAEMQKQIATQDRILTDFMKRKEIEADKDAEIERLKAYIQRCKSGEEYWVKCLLERPQEARVEAITEFEEKLKAKLIAGGIYPVIVKNAIEKIAKEMKEGNGDA